MSPPRETCAAFHLGLWKSTNSVVNIHLSNSQQMSRKRLTSRRKRIQVVVLLYIHIFRFILEKISLTNELLTYIREEICTCLIPFWWPFSLGLESVWPCSTPFIPRELVFNYSNTWIRWKVGNGPFRDIAPEGGDFSYF